jgi:hypothetical protein
MSIISALKTYLTTYDQLVSGAPVLVDFLGKKPTEYSIVPYPGPRFLERYIDGGYRREYPFMIQSMFSTADEAERIENSGFFEALGDWLDAQTLANNLPTLGTKQTATEIEAVNWAFIYEQGQSDTGVYQIQCKLTYEQAP